MPADRGEAVDDCSGELGTQLTAALDLEEVIRQLILRTDARGNRIRQKPSNSNVEVSKVVRGRLQQADPQRVQAGNAHAERVCLQVVALGHTADTRHAEVTSSMSLLRGMMERMLGQAGLPVHPHPAVSRTELVRRSAFTV